MAGILLLIFKDLNKVTLQSPTGKSLTSAFLEIAAAAADIGSGTFILDGELAIPTQNGFSFDLLLSVWGVLIPGWFNKSRLRR
jgi:ATP-dependent DNA ligase